MKKKKVYNLIKYGLAELFPREHKNFSANNSDCSFTYSCFSDTTGELFFGGLIVSEKDITLDIFRTRDTGDDIPVMSLSWNNIGELRRESEKIEGCLASYKEWNEKRGH